VRGHRLIARETLLDTYGFLQDGHGDVTGLVSPAGELVLDYAYDPFGNETTAQTDYAATWDNPFRYCGEYWDEETQTYYLRARQYDPAAGRFLSEDPVQSVSERINNQRITNTLSLNLYVYCANNPVFYHDPSGEFWETVFDFLSFASSFKDVAEDPSLENLLFLTWDTIALAAPILPGSYVTKGVKVLDGIDEVNDSIRGIKKADDITKGLIVPEYVQSTGGFISWTRETFEKTHRVLELEEVKQLFDMASQYDVKISAHLEGHLNTKWPDPHIHLGDKRVHVAVGESTIEWISEQLK